MRDRIRNYETVFCFRSALKSELPSHVVNTVRGKGLFNAIVVSEGFDAWDICVEVSEVHESNSFIDVIVA